MTSASMMQHTLGFPDNSRCIYYSILSDLTQKDKNYNNSLFRSLSTIKSYVLKNNRNKITLSEIKDSTGVGTFRMLEYLFTDTSVKIRI